MIAVPGSRLPAIDRPTGRKQTNGDGERKKKTRALRQKRFKPAATNLCGGWNREGRRVRSRESRWLWLWLWLCHGEPSGRSEPCTTGARLIRASRSGTGSSALLWSSSGVRCKVHKSSRSKEGTVHCMRMRSERCHCKRRREGGRSCLNGQPKAKCFYTKIGSGFCTDFYTHGARARQGQGLHCCCCYHSIPNTIHTHLTLRKSRVPKQC